MKKTQNIANLIAELEYIIGDSCYNPNSYDGYTGEEGCEFRYPVWVHQNDSNRKQQHSIIEIVETYDKEVRRLEKDSEHYSSDKQDAYDECMKKLSGRKINEYTMRALIGKAFDKTLYLY